jgi:hypothetical protein
MSADESAIPIEDPPGHPLPTTAKRPTVECSSETGALPPRRVPSQRPADEGVGVSVSHPVFGLEVADDRHVFLETTVGNDLLPLGNRPAVLRLD